MDDAGRLQHHPNTPDIDRHFIPTVYMIQWERITEAKILKCYRTEMEAANAYEHFEGHINENKT